MVAVPLFAFEGARAKGVLLIRRWLLMFKQLLCIFWTMFPRKRHCTLCRLRGVYDFIFHETHCAEFCTVLFLVRRNHNGKLKCQRSRVWRKAWLLSSNDYLRRQHLVSERGRWYRSVCACCLNLLHHLFQVCCMEYLTLLRWYGVKRSETVNRILCKHCDFIAPCVNTINPCLSMSYPLPFSFPMCPESDITKVVQNLERVSVYLAILFPVAIT